MEHLYVPKLGLGLITATAFHDYPRDQITGIVDMDPCLNQEVQQKYKGIIGENQGIFNELFDHAVSYLVQAKELHDQLEQYYVPYMDFHQVNDLQNEILERILLYAAKAPTYV